MSEIEGAVGHKQVYSNHNECVNTKEMFENVQLGFLMLLSVLLLCRWAQ